MNIPIQKPARALACACVAALVWLPSVASAESYGRAIYQSGNTKFEFQDGGSLTYKDTSYGADLRFDLRGTPFFTTLGGFELQSKKSLANEPVPGDTTTFRLKYSGYNGGLGMVLDASATYEAYARLAYGHSRLKVEFDSKTDGHETFCCSASDSGRIAVGGYGWVQRFVKVYGEGFFDKSSRHAHDYGATVGAEFPVLNVVRVFVEGTYLQNESHDDTSTSTAIGGGIKIPFGAAPVTVVTKKAAAREEAEEVNAPAAAAPAAAPAAPAPVPAPAAAPGLSAKLNNGVQLRAQPKADSPTLATDGSEVYTLKATVSNVGGKWWLIGSAKGTGWVMESEFAVQP